MFEFKAEQFVPRFILADKNGAALAKAIEAGMNYMNTKVAEAVDVMFNVDTMPEWRLNELAWEYNLSLYNHIDDVNTKRQLVKNAIRDSKIYGTKQALINALEYRFGADNVLIEEWHEYSGEPYHFRVKVFREGTSDGQEEAEAIVADAKNARSYCDGVEIVTMTPVIDDPVIISEPEYS